MYTFLVVMDIILAFALTAVVLLQPSKSDPLQGLMSGNNESFFSKNKSRTREAMLAKLTVVLAILFAIVTIALNLVTK
ncbi:MAG: preprotein translocase subunit SecG [Clostridiales bacterium]|nr:preprotein translocase subunit SecG [Clostridiales bacterium]